MSVSLFRRFFVPLEHLVSSASSAKAMLRLNLAPPEVFVVFGLRTTYSLERFQRDASDGLWLWLGLGL